MRYKKVISDLYSLLQSQLSIELTYHSIEHTEDVHQVCEFYANEYEIIGSDRELLLIAACGHDTGFTRVYANHEEVSAEITSGIMNSYGYPKTEIETVNELILSTKIPQNPGSFLAKIICDADLDYLGRDDFASIGNLLKIEWINYDILPNQAADFNDIQIGFLENHFYHTEYAMAHRGPMKEEYLKELILESSNCME